MIIVEQIIIILVAIVIYAMAFAYFRKKGEL